MKTGPRILDIVNTDHAALNFLAYRVNWINRHTEFHNDIVCSRGPHLPRLGVPEASVTAFDIPRGIAPGGIALLLVRTLRHLRRQRYTIVHTHNSITGAVGRVAAQVARVPLIVHTTHGFHFHDAMSALRRAPLVATERWLARWCDVLFCQNRQELEEIHRHNLRPRLGVYHVGNGIDLERFQPRSAPPENARPVILSVGRLEAVKNQPMLFEALRLLPPRHRPVVWLVGDGPLQARYQADLERQGLADSVRFLGYRYDIPELTAAADVAVLTSVKEGIPRALMEAMATGVPVVATNVKGSREVVVDGEGGFLVPLDDAGALAERLTALFDSPALRQEMGARGARHVRQHFDEERIVERLVRLYRVALRGKGLAAAEEPVAAEPFRAERRSA